MSIPRPTRPWERVSLTARLLIATGIMVAISGAMLLVTSVHDDAAITRAGITEKLDDEVAFLVLTVSEEAVIGDYATIQQMLRTRVERADIDEAGWSGTGASPILVTSPPIPSIAPAWFVKWFDVPAEAKWAPIVVGGREYGRVFLKITPTPAVNKMWQKFQNNLQIMFLQMGIIFAAIIFVVTSSLKPLTQLAASAQRFGAGDHSVRIPLSGPEEIRSTVSAFNTMADSIGDLLESLHKNQTILFAEKEKAQVTLESIADAVITTDVEGKVEYLNPIAAALTGWDPAKASGLPLSQVFKVVYEDTHEPMEGMIERIVRRGEDRKDAGHSMLICRGGDKVAIETAASPIRNREGKVVGAVVVFRDVSHARKMAHQLSWQASHDALTGLANRPEFERRLGMLLESTRSERSVHCMLYIDMDQFKIVNDTCGHIAGDELLRQVASLLQAQVRDSDTLARIGGDEFGVLLEGCSLEHAKVIAGKMLDNLSQFRFVWQNNTFVVGASIGLVAITDSDQSMTTLFSAADAACYSAKEKGRNRVQAYLPDDSELALRQGEMQWVSRINRALEQDRLRLYYQTIAPVGKRRDDGDHYEILLRMVGENGELVPPMAFIPAAERYNLMPAIDRKVISLALDAFRTIYRGVEARALRCVAVNLSGSSLGDESFLAFVKEQIARSQIPPGLICFEITETAAIANLSLAIAFMKELKMLGCKFALDDFGSGLSSFAYLKNLPVDYVKIDGSFVKEMQTNPIDSAIVRSINDIAHEMGLETIAEFVDSNVVLGMLREIGVDYAQGYGIAMPESIEKLREKGTLVRLAAPGRTTINN